MKQTLSPKVIDVTAKANYKRQLIGCIFHHNKEVSLRTLLLGHPARIAYLKSAIPKGFHMKVLFVQRNPIGMIEYGPPAAAALPIQGENIIVMNCIWVHRKWQGHGYGKMLIDVMMKSEKNAAGFASIALENFWMAWMKRWMIERLGFKSIESVRLKHKTYKKEQCFTAHLMWLPRTQDAIPPTLDKARLSYGVNSCFGHPLYWGKYGCLKAGLRQPYEKC